MDSLINLLKNSTTEILKALNRILVACIELLPLFLMVLIPAFIISLILVWFKNLCIKVGKNGTRNKQEND